MDFNESQPIWVQLLASFRRRIAAGQWAPSTRIPSVRELAVAEGVNPNTVQRALGELDREGLTIAERAQGRYVTSEEETISHTRTRIAEKATDAHITALIELGYDLDAAQALLRSRWTPENLSRQGGTRS